MKTKPRTETASSKVFSEKPIVLICIQYYLPGFKSGGPIRSVSALVDRYASEFDFRIVAYDRDSGDTQAYDNIVHGQWQDAHRCRIYYLPKVGGSLWHFIKVLHRTEVETIYLQSFFHPLFTLLPLLLYRLGLTKASRCIIAPRGELSVGALSIRKWRKVIFLRLSRLTRLHLYCDWHATSEHEAKEIGRAVPYHHRNDAKIYIAENLVPIDSRNEGRDDELLPSRKLEASSKKPLRVVFLSRIAPKKNLDYAIETLAKCNSPIEFSIFGPIDRNDVYWNKCRAKLESLPCHIQATYKGELPPNKIPSMFATNDVLLLPTRGENFGHVIAESLLWGCPVLISDQTPWRDLDAIGVGWDLSLLDPNSFRKCLDQMFTETRQERSTRRQRAREFARRVLNSSHIVERNRAMLFGKPNA